MADNNPNRQATAVDAVCDIARAVETGSAALIEAAAALRTMVEHTRDCEAATFNHTVH